MAVKHGVYVYENDTALSAPIMADSGIMCVVGAAPVWMLDDPAAVTNVPVLCTSATEAMEKLGFCTDFKDFDLCQTMYITSNIFPVAPVVYINVFDVEAMASETLGTYSFLSSAVQTAEEFVVNDNYIIKSTVIVEQPTGTGPDDVVRLVENVDYTLSYKSDLSGIIIRPIEGSNFTRGLYGLNVSYNYLKTNHQVTAETIVGSYNPSTGKATGAEVIQYVYPKLGVIPSIILSPGHGHEPAVGIALAAKAANINGVFKGIAVLDIDTSQATTYSQVKTVKDASGYTSPFCYPTWPCFKVGEYIFSGSAVTAALMSYTDAQNGDVPARTPSNKLMGVTGTCLADGTEVILTQDQGTIVNNGGVATAINLNGWRLWGSYTGAYPTTTDVKDMWVPVRRMFNWQANTFILTYFDRVDDPLNNVLVESIVDSENIRCAAYAPDRWAGAEIQYLVSDNPTTDLLAGKIVFRQKIAPYTPAQEIDNILSYDTSLLANTVAGLV